MLLDEKLQRAFDLFDKGQLDQAEAIYQECLHEVTDTHSEALIQILHGLGYVKAFQQKFDEARECYQRLMDMALQNQRVMDHCIAVHQLGMVERMAKNYEGALNLFQLEAKLLKDYQIDSALHLSANYYEQGYVWFLMKEYTDAEEWMNQALIYAKQSQDPVCLGCAYRGLGEIFSAKGERRSASQFFHLAKEAFSKVDDQMAIKEIDDLLKSM